MMKFSIPLVLLVAAATMTQAEELYDLRGPDPVKGQVYVVSAKSTGKDLTRTIKFMDQTINDKFDEIIRKKKEVEVLATKGDEITRMRTKIVQDVREEITRKGKRKDKLKSTERELQGQYVYSERTAKGWKNSLEDVTPSDKQKQDLKDYVPFKEEDIFYPKEKVKVGHSFTIDPKLFEKVMGHQFENFKANGSGKFVRVEKKDDDEIAIIEVEFEMTGKSKEDDLLLDVSIKGKGTVERSLKHGFDRRSVTTSTMSMKGGGENDGQKIEVEFSGTTNTEDLVELKLKK